MVIRKETLCKIFIDGDEEADGFTLVSEKIVSSDDEDGGGNYEYVLKEDSTGKFFEGSYCDWDIDNTDWEDGVCGKRVDFYTNLIEVFEKKVVITIYDREQ